MESSDDEDAEAEDAERRLPNLVKDQPLTAERAGRAGHHTQPPARYTEASLVKALEELGIGRPSTYASIMQTIQDRGYVFKRGQALIPSFLAFAVVGLLERHYPRLVDYDFTAAMENELDEIAGGEHAAVDFLTSFYFGSPNGGDQVDRPGGRAEEDGDREPQRDRRAQRQLDPALHRRGGARGRGPGRPVRAVPAAQPARRGAGVGTPRARRAPPVTGFRSRRASPRTS